MPNKSTLAVDFDRVVKDLGKAAQVAARVAERLLRQKAVRNALQSLGSLLIIIGLVWLVKVMMTDEEDSLIVNGSSGRGVNGRDALFANSKTLPFADDDDEEGTGDSLLGGADLDSVEAQLRGQLLDFFSKYNPEKTKTVDAVVAKYSKKIDELNAQLKRKYNADLNTFRTVDTGQNKDSTGASGATKAAAPPTTPPPTAPEDLETRLRKFFLKYNPEKLNSVKQLAKKYSLSQLNAKLRKKYGSDLDDEARIQAKMSGSSSATATNPQVASLERQAAAYFSKHRPGESHAWVSRFVEQYKDNLDQAMGQFYGYRLDGRKVDSIDESKLKRTLERFFRQHNPEKLTSVDEAVAKYRQDVPKLNLILRKKYGIDLNGKKSDGATSELDLLRVRFVNKMGDVEIASETSSGSKGKQSSYLKSLFDRIRSDSVGDDDDDRTTDDLDDDIFDPVHTYDGPDSIGFDTTDRPRKHSQDGGLSSSKGNVFESSTSKVSILCFGLPLTGCDLVQTFASEVLDFTSLTETEAFKRLEHALLQSATRDPHFDVFYDQDAVFGAAPSYFFQELVATYPEARVVIAVRDVEEWWTEFERNGGNWLCTSHRTGGSETNEDCQRVQRRLDHLIFGWDWSLESELTSKAKKSWFQSAYQDYYDLVLGLTPRHHRVLVDVKGGFRVVDSFQALAAMFHTASDSDRWIDRKLQLKSRAKATDKSSLHRVEPPQKQHNSSEDVEADYLGTLHWISSNSERATETHAAKAFLMGLDATGGEYAGTVLENMDLIKAIATTSEWKDYLAQSKGSCGVCEKMSQILMAATTTGASPANPLLFEEDYMGGAPLQLLVRQFLSYYGSSKFILTSRPLRSWLRDIRCFFAIFARPEKKSLLRSITASNALSSLLQTVFLRLYGFPIADYLQLDVSDYLLKRKYQDFVDLLGLIIPAERLMVLDINQGSMALDHLCRFLKLEHKCSNVISRSNVRTIRNVYC